MRPFRVLLEIDRLQSNFPYGDNEHYYLVILEHTTDTVVGFCDLDYRSPLNYNDDIFTLLRSSSNHIVRQRPYLSDLVIHPNHRRKGLASALMEEAHEISRRRGIHQLFLGVAEDNTGARKMYDGLGYELLDYFDGKKNGFGVDGTVALLRLDLAVRR